MTNQSVYTGATVVASGTVKLAAVGPQFSSMTLSAGGTTMRVRLAMPAGAATIVGHGNDIWGGTRMGDFDYVTVPTNKPFDVVVHIASLTTDNGDGWPKAGIMARDGAAHDQHEPERRYQRC